jgi:hypothetical protein
MHPQRLQGVASTPMRVLVIVYYRTYYQHNLLVSETHATSARGCINPPCSCSQEDRFGKPCEPGGVATDAEDGDLTRYIVTCPPEACLPVGCPLHSFRKKGIQGCGIDTVTREPGTEYTLKFIVWDRNVPPKMATAERIIRVISPCSEQELYCPGLGAAPTRFCSVSLNKKRGICKDHDKPEVGPSKDSQRELEFRGGQPEAPASKPRLMPMPEWDDLHLAVQRHEAPAGPPITFA